MGGGDSLTGVALWQQERAEEITIAGETAIREAQNERGLVSFHRQGLFLMNARK